MGIEHHSEEQPDSIPTDQAEALGFLAVAIVAFGGYLLVTLALWPITGEPPVWLTMRTGPLIG